MAISVTSVTTSTAPGAYTVSSGTELEVFAGGSISAATVLSGGLLVISGGTDAGATILASGSAVASAGSASGDLIYGSMNTLSGGTAVLSGETVENGGIFTLQNGDTASNTLVLSGGTFLISGADLAAANTVLSGGGILNLNSPKATVSGSLTFSGGGNTFEVTSMASATYGDLATISGFTAADHIVVSGAGTSAALTLTSASGSNEVVATITSGTKSDSFTLSGSQYTTADVSWVSAGGGVYGLTTTYTSGTTTSVTTSTAPGTYSETSGNTLLVLSGGSVSAATILSGGFLTVSGGTDTGAFITSGGTETVSAGLASIDQISGNLNTVSGGTAVLTDETVLNGGVVTLQNGDTANNTLVFSGGTFLISGADLAANGTFLVSGGTLNLNSPKATISGLLSFQGGGNTFEVTSMASAGYGDLATIVGFAATDTIAVSGAGTSAALTLTSASGSNEVVATITSGTKADSFTLSGSQYTTADVSWVSAGGGVYDLETTYAPVTTTVISVTSSGAYAETAGDQLVVLSGGSVSAATIDFGGLLTLEGGTDYATTISSFGEELVYAGSASGDQIYGVLEAISGPGGSAGVLTNETVISGGTLALASPTVTLSGSLTFAGGGNTLFIAVAASSGYGDLAAISGFSSTDKIDVTALGTGATLSFKSSGGNEDVTVTGTGGSETLIFSGTTTYTSATLGLVSSGGFDDLEYSISGFSAAGTITSVTTSTASGAYTETSGNTLLVLSGGSVSAATIDSGGFLIVSGGVDSASIVSSGGTEIVFTGSASGDQIYGSATVFSGGDISSETVESGGALNLQGTLTSNLRLLSGGTVTIASGGLASGTSGSGTGISGTENVQSGGTLEYATVFAGGILNVSSGANAEHIMVSTGGIFNLQGGLQSATILSGGTLITSSGSVISGSVLVGSGGTLVALGGASGRSNTFVNGGNVIVESGASVTGQIVLPTGVANLTIGTGGTASATTVSSGGVFTISGGAETSATISAGGTEIVSAGSATGDFIYGTVSTISGNAGVFTSETVENGGTFLLANSNSAAGTLVLSGGTFVLSGKNAPATGTVLSGGGTLELDSPKANISGSLTFEGGGNTLDIAVVADATYGDLATISGFSSTDEIDVTAIGPVLGSGGLSFSSSGGNEDVTVSGTGGSETLIFAGTTTYTSATLGVVSSGGHEYLDYSTSGFTSSSTTTTVSAPTSSGAYTVTSGNTLLVVNGGIVSAATIDSGGSLIVNGGADIAATVLSGGSETVSAGSATGDQIFGSAIVTGGAVSSETLSSGGFIDLATQTATLTGTLTFSGGGNTLEASAIATTGAGDQAVISGFSTSDKIDVTGISPGAALSFTTNGAGDSVATITGTGGSESFIFSSPAAYNSSTMSLISDGYGGVDLVLDTTPVVTFTSLSGLETNQAKYTVNGTVNIAADPEAIGTTVSVFEGNTVVGTGMVGANGYWNASVTFLNDDGTNVLTASDTDAASQTGTTSQSLTYNVNTTAAAFAPGNLVLSISGDGDGSGSYTDNQAGPITLEQITTSGTIVSQLVLPETMSTVNGVTEYAISGEYGSSSEGTLELSADGHSLVIAGYGVNPQTYNQGGAAVYGNAAEAQSTSVPGGQYTAVPRVIADINADGTVDTSTALYNVFNTNNPRSVATVNGSSFYIAGQGVKGDTTQGVFYAVDGASSATIINDATDVRTAEIYNNQLYVSANSTQGTGGTTNISNYGTLPVTSATLPSVLTGLSNSIVLTTATENNVNGADLGTSVNLSPENFFFAGPDTLYVADGGAPKAGGLGDGGLQKWVFNGTQWTLEYTLSAGLNLVPNTAGSASTGDTGLIGLTGVVSSDGTSVQLYATTEPLNDLGQTAVVEITDTLNAATPGANESFATLLTASAGENIRGIAFAPAAYAPVITGTVAGQTTDYEAPVTPFSGVTIADANSNAIDTLTITVGGTGGTLADGNGFSGLVLVGGVHALADLPSRQPSSQVYTLTGTAAAITSELDALVFTPKAGTANSSNTSTFTLSDTSSANSTPTVDSTTTVIDNDPAGAISTTAAYVSAHIDGLNADSFVTSITLTDSGTPVLTLTAAQAADDTAALSEITNENFDVSVNGVLTLHSGGNGASGASDLVSVSSQSVDLASNARMDLTGSADTVTLGANSNFGIYGSNNAIAASSGDNIWLNGGTGNMVTGSGFSVFAANGISATIGGNGAAGPDDYVAGSDVTLTLESNSRMDVGGSNDSVTLGANSTFGLIGSNNTIAASSGDNIYLNGGTGNVITGSGFSVVAANGISATIGGNGAAGPDDYVGGSDVTLTLQSNSRMDVGGSNDSVTLGANSTFGLIGSNNTIAASSGDYIYLNGGTGNTITGSGFSVVAANGISATIGGNGAAGPDDYVAGSGVSLTLQSNSRMDVGGSNDSVTLGAASTFGLIGSNNTIAASSGDDIWLNGGSGNSVTAGANDLLHDFASGSQIAIGGNVGTLSISNFGADTSGLIDLLNGAGGYGSAAAAASALTSDGHGGSQLSLGAQGSIDFAGVAANALSAANFKIG